MGDIRKPRFLKVVFEKAFSSKTTAAFSTDCQGKSAESC
jgi:hypothetical protein